MSNQDTPRVNIQFSIELDELPSEINRLIEKSNQHIINAKEFYAQLSSSDNNLTTEGWEKIDNIRRSLAKSDQVLDDLQRIISGYLRMKNENFAPPEQPPVIENSVATSPETESPFLAQHPDAKAKKGSAPFASADMDVKDLQSHMLQVMSHMQQKMDADSMTEEQQKAADILRNRLSRVMENADEKSTETGS